MAGDGNRPKQPQRRGCLGCLGLLLVLVLVAAAGVWGAGRYLHAVQSKRERAMAEARTAEERKVIEAMQAQALMDPNLGTEAIDRRVAAAAPDADPDGDGLTSEREVTVGTDPLSDDTDGDGLTDGDELDRYGSDPRKVSTADDGVPDLVKVLEHVDPKAALKPYAQPFQKEYAELGVILRTTDPASRHLHQIEPIHSKVIDALNAVREPIILREFTGEVSIAYPDTVPNPKRIKAYYYNLTERKLVEIDRQENDADSHRITFFNTLSAPIVLLHQTAGSQTTHIFYLVYYRFPGVEKQTFLVEIDPLVFAPVGAEHDGYIHIRVPQQVEETYFLPLYEGQLRRAYAQDDSGLLRAIFDVRRVEATYARAEQLLLNPELAVAEGTTPGGVPSPKAGVYDSGFRVDTHAFSFKNLSTVVSPGGICAGMATLVERVYNGTDLPVQYEWTSRGQVAANGQKAFAYDWTLAAGAYKPFVTGHLFDYTFKDPVLLEDLKGQPDNQLDAGRYGAADRELIRGLELYWAKLNEEFNGGWLQMIARKLSRNWQDAALIDQLKETFRHGEVVTVLLAGHTGHAVNGYRLTQDEADPNLFYLDLYDNNFPNNRGLVGGEAEPRDVSDKLRIKLILRTKQGLWGTNLAQRDVFEFEFPGYKLTSATGGRIYFLKDGIPMFD